MLKSQSSKVNWDMMFVNIKLTGKQTHAIVDVREITISLCRGKAIWHVFGEKYQ